MVTFSCKSIATHQKPADSDAEGSVTYLDADRGFSHPDKVFPLQQSSESPLQCDDESEDFPVEQGLETLTRRLTQEHLRGGTTASLIVPYLYTQTKIPG